MPGLIAIRFFCGVFASSGPALGVATCADVSPAPAGASSQLDATVKVRYGADPTGMGPRRARETRRMVRPRPDRTYPSLLVPLVLLRRATHEMADTRAGGTYSRRDDWLLDLAQRMAVAVLDHHHHGWRQYGAVCRFGYRDECRVRLFTIWTVLSCPLLLKCYADGA